MARAKQETPVEDLAASLVPGVNVIARAKGYPAWPAVVVGEKDVPAAVRKAKPSRKVVVPVLFYNDNSFLWISPSETELLSPEVAHKNANAKIKRTLKDAYAIAADPPAYEKLVAIATGAEPAELAPEPEEAPAPTPKNRRARSAAEQAAEAPQRSRKRGRATESPVAEPEPVSASAPASKRGKRSSAARSAAAPGGPDEDDDEEYVDNGTEEESVSTSAESEGLGPETLAHSQGARLSLCSSIRETLQTLLVSGVSDELIASATAALDQLNDAPEIEICVARRSKLLTVLVNLQHLELPADFRPRTEALVQKWSTVAEPIIRGIPEDLAPKDETEEPEDFDESVDPSREPTPRPASSLKVEEPGTANGAQNGLATPDSDAPLEAVQETGETQGSALEGEDEDKEDKVDETTAQPEEAGEQNGVKEETALPNGPSDAAPVSAESQ